MLKLRKGEVAAAYMVYIYWIKKYNKWWMSKWHLNPQNVGFWGWYLLCDREAIVQ